MAKIALASSQEALARNSGHTDVLTESRKPVTETTLPHDAWAWLVPSWNGRARVNKPPLLVWINLLAWSGLDPATAAGVLAKGPITVAFAGVPVLPAIVVRSRRGTMNLAELVLALGLAARNPPLPGS